MDEILEFVKWTFVNNAAKELDNTRLSRNFTLSEFSCQCGYSDCNTTYVSRKLIHGLQCLRDAMGVPLKITSGYRCERHNLDVGGSKGSQHIFGRAADVRTQSRRDMDSLLDCAYALSGLGGLGRYRVGGKLVRLHIDFRPKGDKLVEWEDIK